MPKEVIPCPTQGCDGIATAEVDYDAGGNLISPIPRILRMYGCTNVTQHQPFA